MMEQIIIKKSDKTEKFDENKIINSLLNAGLQSLLAVKVANEILAEIKKTSENSEIEISSKEIKLRVYEKLKNIAPKIADTYLKGKIMKVRTSLSTFEDFNVDKISKSLVEETEIDEKIAKKIAKSVEKQMRRLNIEFITAPLIREIVCVELLKNGFERERKLYTRLGMPVYDVTFLMEHGSKENANLQFNPETIHKLMADQISKEYSLINVLPLELADAHMRGEIHIHDLDYFCIDGKTPIWTANPKSTFTNIGEYIDSKIGMEEEVAEGVFVKSVDIKLFSGSGVVAKPYPVTNIIKRKPVGSYYMLTFSNGDNISALGRHKFFTLRLPFDEVNTVEYISSRESLIEGVEGYYIERSGQSKFEMPKKLKVTDDLNLVLNQVLYNRKIKSDVHEGYIIIFPLEHEKDIEYALKRQGIPYTRKLSSSMNKRKGVIINSKLWSELLLNLAKRLKLSECKTDDLKEGFLVEVPKVIEIENEIKEINVLKEILKVKDKIIKEDASLLNNIWVRYKNNKIIPIVDITEVSGDEEELVMEITDNSSKDKHSLPVNLKINDDLMIAIITGVVSKKRLKNKQLNDRFKKAIKNIFGKYIRERKKLEYLLFNYVFDIGKCAENKRFPGFIISIADDNIHTLLEFYKKCDGNSKDEYYTTSKNLSDQIKWLLRRIGKSSQVYSCRDMIIIKESSDNYVDFENSKFVAIRKKSLTNPPEFVYDITCPQTSRYVAGASPIFVHNCTRPFCFSHDIRFFLKHGLKVDGVGNHTAVAGPAKNPEVAILHAAKVLASAQVNCAGGQGFNYFNTFLAPYVDGLPYDKVKQLAQMFIYEMSMMYVARGGQSVHHDESIFIKKGNGLSSKFTSVKIGEFVDEHLKKYKDKVVKTGWGEILKLSENIKTISLDPFTSKFKEYNITGISRHIPADIFLYKIETDEGRSVRVTDFHSMYTLRESKMTKVRASELSTNDFVVVPEDSKIIDLPFTIDKIVSITKVPTSEHVYDLEVAPNGEHIENFLANSILVSNTVFSSIDCDMSVPEQFKDIPAVLPGGIIKENVTYADFEDETMTLFNAFIDVYLKGDFMGKAFNFPKFEVQIYPKKLNENDDLLLKISQLAAKFGTPYYIINQPYMPLYACYQSMPYDEEIIIVKDAIIKDIHTGDQVMRNFKIGEYVEDVMRNERVERVMGIEGEIEVANAPIHDYVTSLNLKTFKVEIKRFEKVMRHRTKERILKFVLEDDKSISATQKHNIYVIREDKLQEITAENVRVGDYFVGLKRAWTLMFDISRQYPVYDNNVTIYKKIWESIVKPYMVKKIEERTQEKYVYDLVNVDENHNFANSCGIFSSNCCSFLMPLTDANTEQDVINGTIRGGGLQVVTTNLPQIAYESNRDENKFFEILKDRMEKAKRVHLLKREIIKKNQSLGMLPFMSQIVNERGDEYLDVDRQSFIIGLVGMNECVKFMTDYELHEDVGWKFGLRVMNKMRGIVAEIRNETALNFSLARTPAESCSYRLAQIDSRRFPDRFIANGKGKDAYYTNSFHVRPSANIPLWKRLNVEGSFHPITDGGAMTHVWLGEQNPSPEAILSLTKKIATKTAIQYMAFTKDLTVCNKCNFVTGGLHDKCPNCNSKNVEWWSRITGYYQNIKGWNKGKIRELQDRMRYGFENNDKITAKEGSFTMKEEGYEAKFERLKEKLKYDTSLDL